MKEELLRLLFNTFFYNNYAYATQKEIDGEIRYLTQYHRIDANKIGYYIDQKVSLLSYQQKFDKLKWICLDFDIVKRFLSSIRDYDFVTDEIYKPLLLNEVEICCKKLNELSINYLLEYSGNRGIHIWIFFDTPISKSLGFTILEKIIDETPFQYLNQPESPIGVDLFPKVPSSRTNIVGKGVKVPLSYHLKSNSFSYLISDLLSINKVESITDDLLMNQLEILKGFESNDVAKVVSSLSIDSISSYNEYEKIKTIYLENSDESKIIESLRKSNLFIYLLDNISTLSEDERRILVGTFARIQVKENKQIGIDILKKLFSKSENYNQELTENKIDLLKNFYPPNITHIEKVLDMKCDYCSTNNIINVFELLDDVEIRRVDHLESMILWAINGERNYLMYNDEVPLNFIDDEIRSSVVKDIKISVKRILDTGQYSSPSYYKYSRDEGKKIRYLYSLSGRDRIVTTVIMKYIYDFIGLNHISSISYSYRINTNNNKSIFMNWNNLWMEFVRSIQDITNHDAYKSYYVIKLDIKHFYDSINLTLLRQILFGEIVNDFNFNGLKLSLSNLTKEELDRYHNAVEYLIWISKSLLESDEGVPQGPAYARYLAELYLSSLDNYLYSVLDESNDFVCRYVDDYYIFIKDTVKGKELEKEILIKLKSMYLNINDKYVSGILEDVLDEIILFNQFEKYFIDEIDDSSPDSIKHEGRRILNTMFDTFIEDDNFKDFPFFLTHLWDDDYAKSKSKKLITKIQNTSIGRGSLFKHFYNKIAIKYSDLEFFEKVKGLSRSNLITSLMRNEEYCFNDFKHLIEFYLSADDIEPHDKKELLRLSLIKSVDINTDILQNEDYEQLISLIPTIPYIKWPEGMFEKTLSHIQSMQNNSESLSLLEQIINKSDRIPSNDKFIQAVYAIFHQGTFDQINSLQYQQMYNLTCYISLFLESNDMVSTVWNIFLTLEKDEIKYNEWLKYDSKIDLSLICSESVTTLLTKIFKNESYIRNKSATEFEKQFAYHLFLKLSTSNFLFEDSIDLLKLVKRVASESNAIPLLWCCEEGTTYYPDTNIALSNIEHNNRLVLKKGNEILVRGQKELFENEEYQVENLHSSLKMYFTIYKIDSSLANYADKVVV